MLPFFLPSRATEVAQHLDHYEGLSSRFQRRSAKAAQVHQARAPGLRPRLMTRESSRILDCYHSVATGGRRLTQ